MTNISVNLCLSDLPREYIKVVTLKDGTTKKYINLDVAKRKSPDERGNDYYVKVYVPKDARKEGDKPIYVGSGKSHEYNSPNTPKNNGNTAYTGAPSNERVDDDDLPF